MTKKFLPVSDRNLRWAMGFCCHLIYPESIAMLTIRGSKLQMLEYLVVYS